MTEISATEAARNFSDLLDAVEHRNECFSILRRGRVVARIAPPLAGSGARVKEVLRSLAPDESWAADLAGVRGLLEIDDRR